jgi:hypothetical protein
VYARIITTQARPGRSVDEQRRLIEEQLLPLMRQHPGFCGYLALGDAAAGKFMGLSLWDSEGSSFDFGSQRIVQEINAKIQPLVIPGLGGAESFQVILDALSAGRATPTRH